MILRQADGEAEPLLKGPDVEAPCTTLYYNMLFVLSYCGAAVRGRAGLI